MKWVVQAQDQEQEWKSGKIDMVFGLIFFWKFKNRLTNKILLASWQYILWIMLKIVQTLQKCIVSEYIFENVICPFAWTHLTTLAAGWEH